MNDLGAFGIVGEIPLNEQAEVKHQNATSNKELS